MIGLGFGDSEDMMVNLLSYGIKLNTKTKKEEEEFLLNLSSFINSSIPYRSIYGEYDDSLLIETIYFDAICYIKISDGILAFLPVGQEGLFSIITKVLEFVSTTNNSEEDLYKITAIDDDHDFDWV